MSFECLLLQTNNFIGTFAHIISMSLNLVHVSVGETESPMDSASN